jgi:outer membrane murein-binding lipoprotein Lpp
MVTGGGLITLLGLVVLYFMNSNRQDRAQHLTVIAAQDLKIEKMEQRYSQRISELETKIDNLEKEVDTERAARQAAEFEARTAQHRLSLLQPPGTAS